MACCARSEPTDPFSSHANHLFASLLGDGINDGNLDYSRYGGEGGRVFGLPLEDAVRISKISASTGVPAVVTRCIEYLDIMGIEEVGLYRVPGSTTNVSRLKAMFDSGKDRTHHSLAAVRFMQKVATVEDHGGVGGTMVGHDLQTSLWIPLDRARLRLFAKGQRTAESTRRGNIAQALSSRM